MTPATAVIMNRLTRARATGSRKIRPVVVNLVPDPSFRNPAAELYVHGHNTCELVEVPLQLRRMTRRELRDEALRAAGNPSPLGHDQEHAFG